MSVYMVLVFIKLGLYFILCRGERKSDGKERFSLGISRFHRSDLLWIPLSCSLADLCVS